MLDSEEYRESVAETAAEHDMTLSDIDSSRIEGLRLTGMSPWEAFAILA